MTVEINLDVINATFQDRTVYEKTDDELKNYLFVLASQPIENDRIKHSAIIKALVINQILYQRKIIDLDKQNANTQKFFIAIGILSLLATIIDIFKS